MPPLTQQSPWWLGMRAHHPQRPHKVDAPSAVPQASLPPLSRADQTGSQPNPPATGEARTHSRSPFRHLALLCPLHATCSHSVSCSVCVLVRSCRRVQHRAPRFPRWFRIRVAPSRVVWPYLEPLLDTTCGCHTARSNRAHWEPAAMRPMNITLEPTGWPSQCDVRGPLYHDGPLRCPEP